MEPDLTFAPMTCQASGMLKHIPRHVGLCLAVVAIGALATLVYDFSDNFGAGSGTRTEWIFFSMAQQCRLLTYALLFASFPVLSHMIANRPSRAASLAVLWAAPTIVMALGIWWHIGTGGELYWSPEIKRMTPDMPFPMDPDWRTAEVALGRERATAYSWTRAILTELAAIAAICAAVAAYLLLAARRGWRVGAALAPLVSIPLLVIYLLPAPWALVWDYDIFIGDALLGATLFNAIYSVDTLLFGGFAAPSIWVSVIVATNLLSIALWRSPENDGQPDQG